jgi:hypothetical protein
MVELCTNRWWNCLQTDGGTVYKQMVELCTNTWWNCVQTDGGTVYKQIFKDLKLKTGMKGKIYTADWQNSTKQANVRIGF